MAMVLDSVGLTLASPACIVSGSSASSSSSSPSSSPGMALRLAGASPCGQSRIVLPRCHGLRALHPAPSKRSESSTQRLSARNGMVVCEKQQETLVSGEVTSKTWKELVLESDVPVLVDFWAPWCGPCRMIAPLFDELASQYAGRVRCLKLNTDESPTIATDYGIRSIPTVMIFKDGQKKDTVIGAVPKATLISAIEKYLNR